MPDRRRLAAIAVLATITLAGCGGTEARSQAAPAPVAQPPGSPVAPPESAAAPTRPAGPIASQEVHNDGAALRVDVTGLTRTGRLITLDWTITMLQPGSQDWYPGTKMSANQAGLSVDDYSVSGVSLVDPVNVKRYLVATSGGSGADDPGDCVCSTASSGTLQAGDAVSFSATFTAPPPEVTEVNVDLVGLGALDRVPIG